MKTITLCLGIVVFLVQGIVAVDPYSHGSGLTFQALVHSVDELESEADKLLGEIGTLGTLCASSGSEIQKVNDRFLPMFNLQNSQQDDLASTYTEQAKSLQHRTDTAIAEASEANTLATITNAASTGLLVNIPVSQREISESQQVDINALKQEAMKIKGDIIDLTQDTLDKLNNQLSSTNEALVALMTQQDAKKCEYGSGTFQQVNSTVTFKTTFTERPNMILTVTGFAAGLDQPKHAYHNGLGFDKYVTDVSTESFNVIFQSLSGESAKLKKIYCNWAACQN